MQYGGRHDSTERGRQQPQFRPGDWTCAECGASPVFASRTECFRCGAPRPGEARAPEPEFRRSFAETRVFIENLSPRTTWKELKDHFLQEGYPVVYASVSTDRETGESKGHGLLQFETVHAAQEAMERMTGSLLDDYDINVRPDYQERHMRQRGGGAGEGWGGEGWGGGGGEGWGGGGGEGWGGGRLARGGGRPMPPDDEAWKTKAWTRIAGSGDGSEAGAGREVDAAAVQAMLADRDTLREQRDFGPADSILDELGSMGVSLDDARRQRVWWVGRRLDGDEERGRGRIDQNRRDWLRGGREGGGARPRGGDAGSRRWERRGGQGGGW